MKHCKYLISIHAAREGGDALTQKKSCIGLFQSTPPVKAATMLLTIWMTAFTFQSTPPVKAATDAAILFHTMRGFQSTPPVKAAT